MDEVSLWPREYSSKVSLRSPTYNANYFIRYYEAFTSERSMAVDMGVYGRIDYPFTKKPSFLSGKKEEILSSHREHVWWPPQIVLGKILLEVWELDIGFVKCPEENAKKDGVSRPDRIRPCILVRVTCYQDREGIDKRTLLCPKADCPFIGKVLTVLSLCSFMFTLTKTPRSCHSWSSFWFCFCEGRPSDFVRPHNWLPQRAQKMRRQILIDWERPHRISTKIRKVSQEAPGRTSNKCGHIKSEFSKRPSGSKRVACDAAEVGEQEIEQRDWTITI